MTTLSTTAEYLDALFADNGLVELRHADGARWTTGWFDRPEAMLAEVRRLANAGNLFTSLNAPRLRVVRNCMGDGTPIRNDAVAFITRLPFDFDPTRPSGVCSTDPELRLAFEARNNLVAALSKLGWPRPLAARSGNGYHAQYRVRLPNNGETTGMLHALYLGLQSEHGTSAVSFDSTVRNPGRIFRLYGTVNRKGRSTPDRPHRMAQCLIPRPWRQVTARQIETLADYFASRNIRCAPERGLDARTGNISGAGDYKTLDIAAWFQSHGAYKRLLGDSKHAVTCPWAGEHSSTDHPLGTDTVIFEADAGWPGFHCSHAHCAGRTVRDVIARWGDADTFCTRPYTREGAAC